MSSPLVVIDIQDVFINQLGEGKAELLRHVTKAMQKARREKRHVVLVQYHREGPLNVGLHVALKGYSNWSKVIKKRDDGSKEIHTHLSKKFSGVKTLTVCGVNLDCCVLETVAGLLELGYKCRIVKEATCNTYHDGYLPADAFFWKRVYEYHARPWRRVGTVKNRVLSKQEAEKNVRMLGVRWV